ncbi:hypothetical protein V2I01_25515 [Micromonospora sp. BRA006-A]|nr:hypothetical protein [Micromonospora sp. BRA006-A]
MRVVPGISAVQAVAARAGAPIGADFAVMSLSDRLKPWGSWSSGCALSPRRIWCWPSTTRAHAHAPNRSRRPGPCCWSTSPPDGRGRGPRHRPGRESLTVTSLGELDPGSIDMKCLLIIGASATRVTAAGRVWSPRFVP